MNAVDAKKTALKVGSKILVWSWHSINEGDTYEATLESVNGNYCSIRVGTALTRIPTSKIYAVL